MSTACLYAGKQTFGRIYVTAHGCFQMFKYTYVGNLRHVRVLCVRAGLFEVRADGVGSLRDRQQP